MSDQGSHGVSASELVERTPRRNCGVTWSIAVDARLEQLVDRANEAGERTNRRELLSAIVCSFDPDRTPFADVLRTFRTSTVGQVTLAEPDTDNVVYVKRFGPGPRRAAP